MGVRTGWISCSVVRHETQYPRRARLDHAVRDGKHQTRVFGLGESGGGRDGLGAVGG